MCRCAPVLVCRCALDFDNNSLSSIASLYVLQFEYRQMTNPPSNHSTEMHTFHIPAVGPIQ